MTTFTSEDRVAAAAEIELPLKLEIHVKLKTNYGNQTIYPNCSKAYNFCRLLGQSTLTPLNVRVIKELGYEVVVDNLEPRVL